MLSAEMNRRLTEIELDHPDGSNQPEPEPSHPYHHGKVGTP